MTQQPEQQPETAPDPYPEHTKLREISELSQSCGEFLEWIERERGLTICRFRERREDYVPAMETREQLLAEFFGIDRDRLSLEKAQMLADLRALSSQQPKEEQHNGE